MTGTTTPRLQLYMPETGETGWGKKVNTNFDRIDNNSFHMVNTVADFKRVIQGTYPYATTINMVLTNDIVCSEGTELTIAGVKWLHIELHGHTMKNVKFKAPSSDTNQYTFVLSGGILDNVQAMESVAYTVNLVLVLDGCIVKNSKCGASTGESAYSTLIVNRTRFLSCETAISLSSSCSLHDNYINACKTGIVTYVLNKNAVTSINNCHVTSCTHGIVLKGKDYSLNNVVVSSCSVTGISYTAFYNDGDLLLRGCTVENIHKGCGVYLKTDNEAISNTKVTLDGGIYSTCLNGGITLDGAGKIQLELNNDVCVYDNYVVGDNGIHKHNITYSPKLLINCNGSLSGKVGIYQEGAVAGGTIGTCNQATRLEFNITCDNGALRAKRDGTTLKWSA